MNVKIRYSFCAFETKTENIWSSTVDKKYFCEKLKGKQTSTCLEICFGDFRCSAVEVSHLKMASNELNSLRKTFSINIMTFSLALETLRSSDFLF